VGWHNWNLLSDNLAKMRSSKRGVEFGNRDGKISLRAHNFNKSKLCKKTYPNMKFTILATVFAALATTGFSAAAVAADAIPVAAVDETTPQGIMDGSEENHRVLRANEPVAANDEAAAPDGGAPAMEGKRALGT
jgi:hypothetical protein